MKINLYRKVNEWLLDYTPFNHWVYFNATPIISGTVAMNMIPGDRVSKEFIDGSTQRELTFSIDMVTTYDPAGTSEVNLQAVDEILMFSSWVEEKATNKDFPDFGEDCKIDKIEVLTNVPSMLIDPTNQLAKYQFQAKITYYQD